MKKGSLQHNFAPRIFGIFIFGIILLFFLLVFGASDRLRSSARSFLGPIFGISRILNSSGGEEALELLDLNKELGVRNSLLEARVLELESFLNFSPEARVVGKTALVSSQAPILPYGTLLVTFNEEDEIKKGMKVIGYGGIYLGEVEEISRKSAVVKLISYPGHKTEAWLSHPGVNITLEGEGGYNMKFSLPKDIKVEVGDKILSNTNPQYLIGEIEIVEERSTEPLAEIIFRHPLNFRNLRYVELID